MNPNLIEALIFFLNVASLFLAVITAAFTVTWLLDFLIPWFKCHDR